MKITEAHRRRIMRLRDEHSKASSRIEKLEIECEILKLEIDITRAESGDQGFWFGILIGAVFGIMIGHTYGLIFPN